MKTLISLATVVLLNLPLSAQYFAHVESNSLNLRRDPSLASKILLTLKKYDNVHVLDSLDGDWLKVRFGSKKGYVNRTFLKSGKALVTTVTGGRIGAICNDGSFSSATGRGACSHHGGVKEWRYAQRQKIEIISNN